MIKIGIIGHVDHGRTTLTAAISSVLVNNNEPIKVVSCKTDVSEITMTPFEQEPLQYKIESSHFNEAIKETRAQRRKRERNKLKNK